jgi:hypothetical protein
LHCSWGKILRAAINEFGQGGVSSRFRRCAWDVKTMLLYMS